MTLYKTSDVLKTSDVYKVHTFCVLEIEVISESIPPIAYLPSYECRDKMCTRFSYSTLS